MWKNREEESMNFRNQNLNFNFVSQGIPFTPNMILPPPNNYGRQFFPEESREIKCVDNTGHSNVSSGSIESSQGNMGNMLLRNCTTQHDLSFTPVNTNSQYGKHQSYNIGSSSQALQAKEESINNNRCGNFQPFHPKKSHFPYNQNFGSTETSQVELQLENTKDVGHKNNSKLCNPYLYPYPFKNIKSNVGNFELNLGRNEMVGGKKRDHDTILEPQIRIPNVDPPIKQTTEENRGKKTNAIFQYNGNTQTNCGSSNHNQILYGKTNHTEQTVQPAPQMLADTNEVSNGVETKQLKQSEESNTDSTIKKSLEGNSISNENVLPDKPIEPAGKSSLLLAEKLWDGTIQLSTTTAVSAVAFFKSGEKAQDMKWPEHLETKGKVRLQAFEKYIQELPRSRNRTLMLISLCWKPGTSEAGLAGMKEIAKVFKEKERVGYAEISQGFDLYVCPRTETIITILAKHGFFKGMAVLEDDQDSLIGCVIWRRSNNTPSNSVPKIVDKKFSPVSSVQESNSPESQEDDLESKQKKNVDSAILEETSKELPKPIQERKQEINGFRSARNFSFDPSSFTYVGAHAPIQVQPSVLVPPLSNQSNGDLTKVPSVVNKKLEPDLKVKNDDNEDDGDLPEFDFDFACGVKRSPTTTTVSPLINHQKLATEVKSVQKPTPVPIKRPIDIAEALDIKHGDPNSLASKKSRWENDDDDDMPEWHPPEMENQSYSNDSQSNRENVSNKCVIKPPLKTTIAPPSTMHPFQIQSQSNVIKPPLKNAREVPLMPPPPPQFGYVHGTRKPPANGFIVNDFRSPAAADFSYGNRNFDSRKQWKRP